MSEEQRYDDEQWDNLPLPDVNNAWQKMEVLLDEDKRGQRLLPWWFWRTAAMALALLGVLAGGWWLHSNSKEDTVTTSTIDKKAQQNNSDQEQKTSISINTKKTDKESNPALQTTKSPDEKKVANLVTPPTTVTSTINKPASLQTGKQWQTKTSEMAAKKNHLPYHQHGQKPVQNVMPSLPQAKKPRRDKSEESQIVKKKDAGVALNTETSTKDSAQQKPLPKKDSTAAKDSAKTVAPSVVQTGEKAKPLKKTSSFVFSAGIGFQQAIALQHQPASPLDSGGRKKPFFDYYPSVYVKVQRGKWAAQVDAQYSVPQPVAGFSFSQKTTYDASTGVLETERINLQKLYYHQVSLSVNYDVLPQWSMGMGSMYNLFAGAVTEREVSDKYTATGTEAVYKFTEPVKGYKDSFFYKTTVALLLQTDYHWKRFSLGLRYTQNLQPFIKYTEPNGVVMNKKNEALQAVLRFRLWRSR